MLLRNRAVALITCWAASPLASALGLGPLEATSALNEPFKGRIEIVGAKSDDFETLKIGLAGEEQFQRAGVERPPVLFKLHFSVDDSKEGKEFITVTSAEPIREPFLNFLLELNWANGRLVREYTVLLDPPLYDPNRRRAPAQTAGAAAPAAPAVAPPPTYYPPPRAAGTASTAPASPAVAAPAATSRGGEIGPVGATDTLWSLAAAHRPDPSVSIQQMMVALLRANPDAFANGNVNMLRRGAVLRAPDDATLRGISNDEAVAEVRRQHQLWQEYRQHIGAAPSTQALGATAPAAPATAPAEPVAAPAAPGKAPKGGDARLELVAPGGAETAEGAAKPGKGGTSGAGGGSSSLLREQLDSTTQQAGDLKGKLTEAEQVIDLLQRQVNIKDQELAALQARLAELGVKAPPAPAGETPDAKPAEGAKAAVGGKDETKPADAATSSKPADEHASKPETKPETTAAKPPAETEPVIDVPTEPAGNAGFPANLVPRSIAESVPGGALTVLGAAALAVVGVIVGLLRALTRKRGDAPTRPVTAVPASTYATTENDGDATTVVATTAAAATVTAAALAAEPVQDEVDAGAVTRFDPSRTVVDAETAPIGEKTVQGLGAVADEADPLEEVNVYLAYERFDQAEDLVKRVISQHPDRHEYKLRLLEVYYSSNDRVRYEEAARALRDAVGEQSPLWESALAMWAEMSPDRALFAEGAALPAAAPAEAATAFVDITGDSPAEATVTHARGGHDTLDLDFGLEAEAAAGEEGASVIDLTGGESDLLDLSGGDDLGGMLDLTSADDSDIGLLDITGGDGDDSNILDLSDDAGLIDISGSDDDAGMLDITGSSADDDLLDITGGSVGDSVVDISGSGGDDADGILDISGGGDVIDIGGGDEVLDITSGGSTVSELLDFTSGGSTVSELLDTGVGEDELDGMGSDLLDVTHTGDIGQLGDHDLLNVTSPGAHVLEASAAPGALDLDISHDFAAVAGTSAEDDALAFDISDTVAPAFGANADIAPEPMSSDGDDGLDLDFDIGGLEVDDVPTVELKQLETPAAGDAGDDLDLDISAGELGDGDLDFDITMGADDLSSALALDDEPALRGGPALGAHADTLAEELSLQGEELDALALDTGSDLDGDFDFSLDGSSDINPISAEDTLDMSSVALANNADLELDDNTSLDDLTIELDSALANTRPAPAAHDDDALHLDTLSLDFGDDSLDLHDDKTVLLPPADDFDRQSDSDEADTKLNLAKAYIELGDAEGARSILDEVAHEGSAAQQAEAKSLLGQLDA